LAGHFGLSFEKAQAFKEDPENAPRIRPLIAPVLMKMGTIIREGLSAWAGEGQGEVPFVPEEICLVGGTALAPGAAQIIQSVTGRPTWVMPYPDLATPAGIALGAYLRDNPSAGPGFGAPA
jgi:ethanolamine utilization protein EutJ